MEILSVSLVETNRKIIEAKEWEKTEKPRSTCVKRSGIEEWENKDIISDRGGWSSRWGRIHEERKLCGQIISAVSRTNMLRQEKETFLGETSLVCS